MARHKEAGSLHHQATVALETSLGSMHARTAWALFQQARHYEFCADPASACAMARRSQEILLRRSGSDHWRARRVSGWLAEHCVGLPGPARCAGVRP
jgi:hypothetical protein